MRNSLMTIATLFVFWACEKGDSNPVFEDRPVVEAYLRVGNIMELQINRQIAFSDEAELSSDNVDALDVYIQNSGITYKLQSTGNGRYADSSLIIQEGEQYDLQFDFDGKSVTASTRIPSKPTGLEQSVTRIQIEEIDFSDPSSGGFGDQPDPVELSWTDEKGAYYLIVVENIELNPKSIIDFGDEDPPERVFRNEPVQAGSYEISSRMFNYYGTHRLLLHHINPDYASLYDDGDNTSQNLTTPLTGISNGVGIFTGINSDTLWLEVID